QWRTNKLTFETRFSRQGLVPVEAVLNSDSFRIPATDLKLRGYSDLSGALSALWRQGQLSLKIRAEAEPLLEKSPRVAVDLNAHGSTNALTIDQLQVVAPFLQVNL